MPEEKRPTPKSLRELFLAALPTETSSHGATHHAHQLYLPATHAKALDPNNMLIEGIRGAGKSFWFSVLQAADLRNLIASRRDGREGIEGINEKTKVSIGFGETSSPDNYPGKDTLSNLCNETGDKTIDPRFIWKTVVFRHFLSELGAEAPHVFLSLARWADRIQWVKNNSEQVERLLFDLDQKLDAENIYHLVLFDALDRMADHWSQLNELTRGLLQTALDFRPYKRLRLKVFARVDQLEDPYVKNFPDASKVFSQIVQLKWSPRDLYGLLWQQLANAKEKGKEKDLGALFRDGVSLWINQPIDWKEHANIWQIPSTLREEEETQKIILHAMTGPWMGRDKRRGAPYTWLISHLADAHNQVSPRSFLAALRHAAQDDQPKGTWSHALHYENIKRGVQEASRIRVTELEEDYPWVKPLFEALSGTSVPCSAESIYQIWEEKYVLQTLKVRISAGTVRLPPAHIDSGASGVLQDLESLGFVMRLKDRRINLPDVYRVGYGMGRRGGVKPVR